MQGCYCRCGAGGSFGINTSLTFQLVEVPAGVTYYRYDWRGAEAAIGVLSSFNNLIAKAPAALNAVAMAQATPVGPGGPREAIDVMSRGQYIGSKAELLDLIAPLPPSGCPSPPWVGRPSSKPRKATRSACSRPTRTC